MHRTCACISLCIMYISKERLLILMSLSWQESIAFATYADCSYPWRFLFSGSPLCESSVAWCHGSFSWLSHNIYRRTERSERMPWGYLHEIRDSRVATGFWRWWWAFCKCPCGTAASTLGEDGYSQKSQKLSRCGFCGRSSFSGWPPRGEKQQRWFLQSNHEWSDT